MLDRRSLLTVVAVAAAALAAAPAAAQDAPPIKIGMTVSSTGTFALAAQSGERGAEIWVDDVNRRGGVEIDGKKRKVELIKLDDRSDKQLVPRVYEALIDEHKVDLLFGPFGSTLTAAAANVTETKGKFLVIWSASADSIYQQGYKYVVSATQAAGTLLGHPSIKAMHELGVKKIAFVYVDEPFPAAISQGAADLAKKLGMEVTMFEKFAKGTKDFNILIQKARASGAEAFYPAAYEGDQMVIARQLRELQVDFPLVYMVYASQPQFLQIGDDADWLVSQTLLHDKINWQVTDGLNRAQMMERYAALFPNAAYPADFQTILAYGAGAVLEKIITTAQSLEPAELKQAALALNDKIVVATGQYHIEETGRQTKMEFSIMQNQKDGPEVIWPESVRTAKAVYPVPKWSERKN